MSKPSAIITTLEDSAPWLDQRLVMAYLRTTYRMLSPLFDLRIGQMQPAFDRWLTEESFHQFAFITAWNPHSKPQPAGENEHRNHALEKDLHRLALQVRPGQGISDDRDWTEDGFFALVLAPEQAVELGRAFGQNAIIFGQKGRVPELWWLPEP